MRKTDYKIYYQGNAKKIVKKFMKYAGISFHVFPKLLGTSGFGKNVRIVMFGDDGIRVYNEDDNSDSVIIFEFTRPGYIVQGPNLYKIIKKSYFNADLKLLDGTLNNI